MDSSFRWCFVPSTLVAHEQRAIQKQSFPPDEMSVSLTTSTFLPLPVGETHRFAGGNINCRVFLCGALSWGGNRLRDQVGPLSYA